MDFPTILARKKGRFWKEEGGIVAADSFQIDWKTGKKWGGGDQTPRINKRKNANFMALLFPNIIKFYIGFSAVFNWLISFQIDHWR